MTCERENTDAAIEPTPQLSYAALQKSATDRKAVFLRFGLNIISLGAMAATCAIFEIPFWLMVAGVIIVLVAGVVTYRRQAAHIRFGGGERMRTLLAVAFLATSMAAFAVISHVQITVTDERTEETWDAVGDTAGELTAAVLTYKGLTVEGDVAQAKSHLTGEFLDSYSTLTAGTIIPQAKQEQVETHWEASGTSVVSAESDSAEVLVFLRGTTASAAKPNPTYLFSSVRVRMEASGDQWLISQLEAL